MDVPDMRDDEAVDRWIWGAMVNAHEADPDAGAVCALRSLCREVARKVVANCLAGETMDAALVAILGPATEGE